MDEKCTALKMSLRRTSNPQELAWEVSASGEFGHLQLQADIGPQHPPLLNMNYVGTAAADGGITRVAPHIPLNFQARVIDSVPQGNSLTPRRTVIVSGTMRPEDTVMEIENHDPQHGAAVFSQGVHVNTIDVLGSVWYETEVDGWVGVWTRIGATDEFNANFTHPSHPPIGGRLKIQINGQTVQIKRWNPNGAPGTCRYVGTLSPDFTTVTGSYSCTDQNGRSTPNQQWNARISR